MSKLGVEGLRAEREAILEIAKSLSDDEWNAPSDCEGWAVRDVIAHMGSIFHGIADPSKMIDLTSGTEVSMEAPVAERRELPVADVLAEYETYSAQVADMGATLQDPPMSETMLPMGDLGTHPMAIMPSTFVFDGYCHLRNDILKPNGPIDRPEPPRDEQRLQPTVEWMLAGLPWMCASQLAFVDRPITLEVTGVGGGTWTIGPGGDDGRVLMSAGAAADSVATVTTDSHDFVIWGTKRRPWRDFTQVTGDTEYATRARRHQDHLTSNTASPDVATRVAPAREPRLKYRPYLDGLRCVAVYLVVAFHAGLERFSGGFIGVDVFFVLSGYLMTSILVRELVKRRRIGFQHFYARRFRRILPAAAATLLITAFVYGVVATPFEGLLAGGDFRSAFLYYANWHFLAQSADYFAPSVDASPVLHFWSLAIEEQFYLAWPLLLSALFAIARQARRWQWWVLRGLLGALVVASAGAALHYASDNLDRAYYGTDTRVYQLLAGGLVAITPQLVTRGRKFGTGAQVVAVAALVGLLGLGTSAFTLSPITRGIAVVACTAALIVALECAPRGLAGFALSDSRIAYLGRISYGTYLWHWPIIVVLTRKLDPGVGLFVIVTLLSTVLAAISFHLLEHPIRASRALNLLDRRVVTVALAFSLVAGILIAPALRAFTGSTPDVSKLSVSVPDLRTGEIELLDWVEADDDIPRSPDCRDGAESECVIVRGNGKRVLLMGDSVARMWIPAFAEIARREDWTLAVATSPGCPWWVPDDVPGAQNRCAERRAYWYDHLIPEFDPDIVFAGHRALDAPGNPFWVTALRSSPTDYRIYEAPHPSAAPGDSPAGEQAVRRLAERSLDALQRPDRALVILEPAPIPTDPTFDPLNCVSTGSTNCGFTVDTEPTPAVANFRALAQRPDAWSLDLDRLACPRFPVCDPVVNDIITRRDHTHVTGTYAEALATDLEAQLRAEGILPRSG